MTQEKEILEKIEQGKIKILPHWYYLLKNVLIAVGTVILVLFVVYVASLVVFMMSFGNAAILPRFGWLGVGTVIAAIPWWIALLVIGFLLLLELVVVKQTSFGYRKPVVYSLLLILLFVLATGFAVAQTGLHHRLYLSTAERPIPALGHFYSDYGQKMEAVFVHRGNVVDLNDENIIVTAPEEEKSFSLSDNTRFPSGRDLSKGDPVAVMARERNGEWQAWAVQKLRRLEDFPMPMMNRRFKKINEINMHPGVY